MSRSTMAALIASVRLLVNDPNASVWTDDQIQDVMDESRVDYKNYALVPRPTFTGSTISYLDYWAEIGGGWEDGYVLKQYLITPVTPSVLEPIAGHWQFASTTLPPVYLSGSLHDRYRAAADLLERQAAQWVLRYNMTVDGQSLQRSQVTAALQNLARTYRMQQRPGTIHVTRTDIMQPAKTLASALGAQEIDFMGSGDGH